MRMHGFGPRLNPRLLDRPPRAACPCGARLNHGASTLAYMKPPLHTIRQTFNTKTVFSRRLIAPHFFLPVTASAGFFGKFMIVPSKCLAGLPYRLRRHLAAGAAETDLRGTLRAFMPDMPIQIAKIHSVITSSPLYMN